ncbi:glycoside hydrolase family 20 zincin-like fold domain-containing protein [Poriferisphaera sp. WC338]|uniref:glycoside hydrolase family 20 zincin-like fold domain-containing protein n=1 Tax=Poriferisphaera sp. WC338 TaxID=3425129 RepID=UPI003D814C04
MNPLRVLSLCLSIFAALGSTLSIFTSPAHAQESPWSISWDEGDMMSVSYQGVPIIWKSTQYVVKPGWLGTYYGDRVEKYKTESKTIDGKQILKVQGKSETFATRYQFTELDDNTLKITFAGQLLKDVPCTGEMNMGFFNANLIQGKSFIATLQDGKTVNGRVPVYPKTMDRAKNNLMPGAKAFTFDSILGKLSIQFTATRPIEFFDARNYSSGWSKTYPMFWAGYVNWPGQMKESKNLKWEMIIKVNPSKNIAASTIAKRLQTTAPAILQTKAIAKGYPKTGQLIVPQPQSIKIESQTILLGQSPHTTIFNATDNRLSRASKRLLDSFAGIASAPPTRSTDDHKTVRIWIAPANTLAPSEAADTSAKWFTTEDGYRLTAKDNGVLIESASMRGAFYGLQTLKQLLRIDQDGFELPAAQIKDWPDLKFRGALFFPAESGYQMDRKLIQNIFAPLKMNTVVIELDKIKWDTQPDIAYPDSISKDKVRELVKLARENFLEPVPLVNVPGHAGWMFNNDQNKDICEDWSAKYALCTKNPKTFETAYAIFDEAIEMFDPKVFHIGHDEVLVPGKFPNPECNYCGDERDETKIFMAFMNRSADYLRTKGIRAMVWSDMMLYKGEAPDATTATSQAAAEYYRSNLPEDIIVGDWHYAAAKDYKSQAIFKKAGADVVGCTWSNPTNIYYFAKEVKKTGNLGTLQTMWCGFFPNEETIKLAFKQFSAHVLSAEYAWGSRKETPDQLPYAAGDIFNKLYTPPTIQTTSGNLIDLNSIATVPHKNWPLPGTGYNLARLPKGEVNLNGYTFLLNDKKLVMLGSSPATPNDAIQSLTISTPNLICNSIALLNAGATNVMPNTKLATMTVTYADNNTETMDLISNQNTSGLIAGKTSTTLKTGWMGRGAQGGRMAMFITDWQNPHPNSPIMSITFTPATRKAGWLLAGLTLLD